MIHFFKIGVILSEVCLVNNIENGFFLTHVVFLLVLIIENE